MKVESYELDGYTVEMIFESGSWDIYVNNELDAQFHAFQDAAIHFDQKVKQLLELQKLKIVN